MIKQIIMINVPDLSQIQISKDNNHMVIEQLDPKYITLEYGLEKKQIHCHICILPLNSSCQIYLNLKISKGITLLQ